MKKIRLGFVGAGGVTELHLAKYKEENKRFDITAICDPDFDTLQLRANKYNIPNRYTDLNDFIAAGGLDIVVVCTPTSVRKQVVFPLLDAKIPLFVEKPFTDNLREAIEITQKAQALRVPISINQNFRYFFPFERVREIISEGTIGKVTSVQFSNMEFRQDAGWRIQTERHALSVMGIHWVDGFRRILDSEARSVACLMKSSDAIQCAGETDATLQIEFHNGTMVTYIESFSSKVRKIEMVVIGEKGTLLCDYDSVKLYVDNGADPQQLWGHKVSREEASLAGLEQLITSLETGNEAANSSADNLNTIAVLEAAYVSATEKRVVQLKDMMG